MPDPTPSLSDAACVHQTLSGDREAFAELVRRHQLHMLHLCRSLLGHPAEAEDAAQEIFLKAYASLQQFRADASFSTWLYRIASNYCLDQLRQKARRRTESLDAILERDGEKIPLLLNAPPANLASPENWELAEHLLSSLPADYRLVLTLREAQGMRYQEIAETLDISIDSVKARLRRAREQLSQKLRHFLARHNV